MSLSSHQYHQQHSSQNVSPHLPERPLSNMSNLNFIRNPLPPRLKFHLLNKFKHRRTFEMRGKFRLRFLLCDLAELLLFFFRHKNPIRFFPRFELHVSDLSTSIHQIAPGITDTRLFVWLRRRRQYLCLKDSYLSSFEGPPYYGTFEDQIDIFKVKFSVPDNRSGNSTDNFTFHLLLLLKCFISSPIYAIFFLNIKWLIC